MAAIGVSHGSDLPVPHQDVAGGGYGPPVRLAVGRGPRVGGGLPPAGWTRDGGGGRAAGAVGPQGQAVEPRCRPPTGPRHGRGRHGVRAATTAASTTWGWVRSSCSTWAVSTRMRHHPHLVVAAPDEDDAPVGVPGHQVPVRNQGRSGVSGRRERLGPAVAGVARRLERGRHPQLALAGGPPTAAPSGPTMTADTPGGGARWAARRRGRRRTGRPELVGEAVVGLGAAVDVVEAGPRAPRSRSRRASARGGGPR